MANFNSMILTNKGQVLYAKGQAGKVINFTKIAVGIGDVGNTDPQTLTDLVSKKFDIAIQSKAVNTLEKVAIISGTLTNENMTESVYIQEIGLYALDPDDGEILYSYATAGEYGDYTSPASNGPYAWNYQVYAAIGNAANVTVTLSNLQYDTGIINTNNTLSIIKGSNQKEINKSIDDELKYIDNKFKIYDTTNSGNVYTIANSDIGQLEDGFQLKIRFNADSTGNSALIVNNSNAMDIVDYFGNKVSNIRKDLIANIVYDAKNANFQVLGKGGDGDATSDVLVSPYTATTRTGPITGTLADNYNTDNIECTPTVFGTTLKLTIPDTARYKQGNHLQVTDSNFVSNNIRNGVKIFGGLTGSLIPLQSASGTAVIDSNGYFTINLPFILKSFIAIGSQSGGFDCASNDEISSYIMYSGGSYRNFPVSKNGSSYTFVASELGGVTGGLQGTISWNAYGW